MNKLILSGAAALALVAAPASAQLLGGVTGAVNGAIGGTLGGSRTLVDVSLSDADCSPFDLEMSVISPGCDVV